MVAQKTPKKADSATRTTDAKATKTKVKKLPMLEPRATEKTYAEQTKRTYVFPVSRSANKHTVKELVEQEFSVTVTNVRILIRDGKPVRFSRGKRAYPGTTTRQDQKYAYVTLKDGDSIKVFEEPSSKDTKETRKAAKSKETK